MNVLKKCCYRSMKENRKRTAVTVVGIILATALITAVACMAESFRASMVAYEKAGSGDFHYLFTGVNAENLKIFETNRNVESFGIAEEMGYAVLEGCRNQDKPYLYVRALDETGAEAMALKLVEGRMPENGEELVISRHIRSNGGVDLKVGDTLTLRIGQRLAQGYPLEQENPYAGEEETLVHTVEKTYTVVGMAERPSSMAESYAAPGYSVFTYPEESEEARSLEVYVTYTKKALKHGKEVTAGILGISVEEYENAGGGGSDFAQSARENTGVVRWELMRFSMGIMNMLYAMCAVAVLIIVIAGVFCIRNSFVISLTEKMKLYGRLASVGTTSVQQRKIVYYEAGFLAAVGIPLGIGSGILAAVVIVRVVGGLVEQGMGFGLVFDMSVPAVILAAAMALLTVFLSAYGSARRAAKVSPISAIRAGDTVKLSRKEIRCPRLIEKLFGIGGKLAYRNLQRAKVKYRTTVVSIVVSVAVFIGMCSFMELASLATEVYYGSERYQLLVSLFDEDAPEKAEEIAGLEGVEQAEIRRYGGMNVDTSQSEIPFTRDYLEALEGTGGVAGEQFRVMTLGESGYGNYCASLGLDPEKVKDQAIVMAAYVMETAENGKRYHYEGEIVNYRPGDIIRGAGAKGGGSFEIEVALQTKEVPMSLSNSVNNRTILIVSNDWWDAHEFDAQAERQVNVYLCCSDPDELERTVSRELNLLDYHTYNTDAEYRSGRSLQLAAAVFLYGFIIVVSLIGVTNIINTVTTNMELRAPEFAICRSVGMTRRQFGRMIWLEGIFYGGKALLLGIPLGILISLAFHKALGYGIVTGYRLPLTGILVSAAAVFVLLFAVMRYSMKKTDRKNIIETVRNENI
ncbi:MAG: ABC transporter permease [bacterium]|nr:ABC transporter permease [bacterium]